MASSLLLLFYTVNTFCLYVYICLGLTFLLIAFASLLHYLFFLYGFFSEGLLIVKCFQSLSENVFFCLTFVFCYHQFRMCWHEFLPFQPVWGSLNFLKYLYLCLLSNFESLQPLFISSSFIFFSTTFFLLSFQEFDDSNVGPFVLVQQVPRFCFSSFSSSIIFLFVYQIG